MRLDMGLSQQLFLERTLINKPTIAFVTQSFECAFVHLVREPNTHLACASRVAACLAMNATRLDLIRHYKYRCYLQISMMDFVTVLMALMKEEQMPATCCFPNVCMCRVRICVCGDEICTVCIGILADKVTR